MKVKKNPKMKDLLKNRDLSSQAPPIDCLKIKQILNKAMAKMSICKK